MTMKVDIEKLFLDSLINSLPDYIYFKDRNSQFLMVNQALADRLGLKDSSEALGHTDHEFFNKEHADQARRDELQVMKTGQALVGKELPMAKLTGFSQPNCLFTTLMER